MALRERLDDAFHHISSWPTQSAIVASVRVLATTLTKHHIKVLFANHALSSQHGSKLGHAKGVLHADAAGDTMVRGCSWLC